MRRPGTGAIARAAPRVRTAACLLGLAASLGVLLYLNAADLSSQWEAQRDIERMQQAYADADEGVRGECLRQARLYNRALAGEHVDATLLPYRKQLFYQEEPMMSFIEIPAISVRLPVYHGTAENALMAGVGHWEGSSLPVGGVGTRCVLMGHSGMRDTRMLDDLHKLVPGDRIVLHTLNDPYCYEVLAAQVVKPDELEKAIAPVPGRDLLTLVTCTPAGVNSHRLVVDAQRCAYDEETRPGVGIGAYVNDRTLPLAVAAAFALALTASGAIRRAASAHWKHRKKGTSYA